MFLRILESHQLCDESSELSVKPDRPDVVKTKAELGVSEHIRDFLPSIVRSIRFRSEKFRSRSNDF